MRQEHFGRLDGGTFDLVIIGGGIHGACLCRDAALRGLRVALIEKHDFAFGTSSRSSKLLHGGVRYLEQGNFSLVRDALRERSYWLQSAPHLTTLREFVYPILPRNSRPLWQARLGFRLYDWLGGSNDHANLDGKSQFRYRILTQDDSEIQELQNSGLQCSSGILYFDGQMDDARIVVECLVDAVENGAVVVNYCDFISGTHGRKWTLNFRCAREGIIGNCESQYIANLTGPWSVEILRNLGMSLPAKYSMVFSRGIHLLFQKHWKSPAVILPTGIKKRYYFVLPTFHEPKTMTLVGTTDRATSSLDEDPQAIDDEREELLGYLARDIPHSGLSRENLVHDFCGLRTLLGSKHPHTSSSDLSRTELPLWQNNVVSLIGGKFTTARRVAEKICDEIEYRLRGSVTPSPTLSRSLPGAKLWTSESKKDLVRWMIWNAHNREKKGVSALNEQLTTLLPSIAERAVQRFGVRVREIFSETDPFDYHLAPEAFVTRAELKYVLKKEFVLSVADVLERRLGRDREIYFKYRPAIEEWVRKEGNLPEA